MTNQQSTSRGFTLLETLVVIALLSLLTLVLFTGLKFGSIATTRSDAAVDRIEKIARAQNFLRQLLSGTYPARLKNATHARKTTFNGDNFRLEFSANLPRSMGVGGFYRVVLRPVARSNGSGLRMSWRVERNEFDGVPSPANPNVTRLLSSVSGVSFSYYGRKKDDRRPSWHSSWTDQEMLPKLIRIDGKLEGETALIFWPPLVIRTYIEADAGCVYDALTDNCRAR